jgi:uncharacterized protein (DUF305 family)
MEQATSAPTMAATSGGAAATKKPAAVTATKTAGGAAGQAAINARTQRAEIRFLTEAMDTNQVAVDLANDCLPKAKDKDVMALCQKMTGAHADAIKKLHDYLMATYRIDYLPTSPAMQMAPIETPAPTMSTIGTIPNGFVVAANNAKGSTYDVGWLEAMSDVHSDLISEVNRVLSFNINANLKAMAQTMRTTANSELNTMQTLIVRLGGNR